MKTYTAITRGLNHKTFKFETCDGNQAKKKVIEKFGLADILICDEETGEKFPLVDEWLTNNAYISRCMQSGRFLLYVKHVCKRRPSDFIPVIEVTKDIVPETIVNEYGMRMADKSTHKVGDWYIGFPKAEIESQEFAFKGFCEKYGGLTFETI